MAASEAVVFEKFSVKHSWKRLEATCGMRSCGLSHNSMTSVSDGGKKLDLEYLKEKSSMPRSRKREAPKLMEYQRVKRQRIDHSLSSQCSTLLKLQTTHPAGWVSNQPVLVSHMNKSGSDPDSDGAASGLDSENTCLSSQHTAPATDVATLQGCPVYDVHPSPKKALRAAMMKSRFSETILKAQKKTLFDHDNKVDPLKMQREKKRFESIQLQEITKIQAQMKAAEVDEVEAKQRRGIEREKQRRGIEREAFRATLQKMTKTVDLEDNLWAQKEFDMLIGSSCSYYWPRAAH